MPYQLVDTHSHIHFKNYPLDADTTWQEAKNAGVTKMLAVGCDVESSINAVKIAQKHSGIYAVVGIHPHEAKTFLEKNNDLTQLKILLNDGENNKVVAIGEFGLDYFYDHSPKQDQVKLAKMHLELALDYDLPVMLHIRDAYDDFWPIFDEFQAQKPLRGVVHCFTGTDKNLDDALKRELFVALNGIMTFTKDENQLETAKKVPLGKLLLETDAPYLTPKPFRGKICKPEHIVLTAEFLAELRGETLAVLSDSTTKNAISLFNLK